MGDERGTGFLVSADGLVLTALHCVAILSASTEEKASLRAGTIKLRFGDPKDIALGPLGPDGKLFTTTATLVDHSLAHDVALLRCVQIPPVAPLKLAPIPFDGERWSTFGFAAASGVLVDDPIDLIEMNGQAWDGHVSSDSSRLQLTVNQHGTIDLGGISGAPILIGSEVVGVALQSVNQDGVVIQNTLFGALIGSFAPRLPVLPWSPSSPAGEIYLRGMLEEVKAAQLVPAARKFGVSERIEEIHRLTTQHFLTCSAIEVIGAFKQIRAWMKPPPEREYLTLLLCSSRIPDHVAQIAAAALHGDRPAPATIHVGANDGRTVRCLAFRFALETWGTSGTILGAIVDLGVLPGEEDFETAAKRSFKGKMLQLMECKEPEFEAKKVTWLELKQDVYVVAEIGFPPDLAELLKPIYPRVRVLFRGAPPLSSVPRDGRVIVPECASPGLEKDFGLISRR